MENKFTEEDKQKVIDFLNMVAKHASFNLSTSEIIDYFKLLDHMQKSIVPKIDANIFEIKKVIESKKE
jgi:hypothetical protein